MSTIYYKKHKHSISKASSDRNLRLEGSIPGTASEIDEDVFDEVEQFQTSQNNLKTSFRKLCQVRACCALSA